MYYYPFGMEMEGSWENVTSDPDNKYTYNSNELNSDLGLDLMDFQNRWYDPSIGRFTSVDKLADHPSQYDKSPYAYAWNDPIAFNDPDGNCPFCPAIPYAVAGALEWLGIGIAATVTTVVVADAVIDSALDDTGDKTSDDTDDVVTDVPSDSTDDDDDDDSITLYRGVGIDKPGMHGLAMMGTAIPLDLENGHSDPERHNDGDNFSIFTSWSVSESKARAFGRNAGPGGVLLSKKFKVSETVPSPDQFSEGEVLVPGVVQNASVEIL